MKNKLTRNQLRIIREALLNQKGLIESVIAIEHDISLLDEYNEVCKLLSYFDFEGH